jgi:hypothetical protein
MNVKSRRLKTPSPRSISRRRIAGLIQCLDPLLPTEKAGTQCSGHDDFEGSLLDSRYPQNARYLLVGDASGGFTDLAREVIIGSLDGGSTGCPFSPRHGVPPVLSHPTHRVLGLFRQVWRDPSGQRDAEQQRQPEANICSATSTANDATTAQPTMPTCSPASSKVNISV